MGWIKKLALACPRTTHSVAILGGDHPGGVRGPPAGHREDPALCQPGLVQTPRASLSALGDPALLRGLGDPEGRPDDRHGGHAGDAGRGCHRLRRGLRPRALQGHGQVLCQGLAGAEERLQEGDRGGNQGGGKHFKRRHSDAEHNERGTSGGYW